MTRASKLFECVQYRTGPRAGSATTVAFLEQFQGSSPFQTSFPHSTVTGALQPVREVRMGNTRIGMRWVTGIILSTAIAAGMSPSTAGSGLNLVKPGATCQGGQPPDENPDQALEWNQIFIDTLIATNTANSSS